MDIEILSAGSLTMKREDLQRAVEPDECYYVAHAAAVRGKDEVDLIVDPPPDVAIEVAVARSSRNKLPIYSALGVPEYWRYDGERLTIHLRDEAGRYAVSGQSRALPKLPVEELAGFLGRRHAEGETQLVREFRAWLRDHLQAAAAPGDQ